MKFTLSLVLSAILSSSAFAASKPTKVDTRGPGKIVLKADLPESIKTTSTKKESKFPGVPSCSKGRLVTDWGGTDFDLTPWLDGHKCASSDVIYVCQAFGKLSIRCESPSK